MKRLMILTLAALAVLGLNMVLPATAQEADPSIAPAPPSSETTPVVAAEPAPDPYGPPIPWTSGNPWTRIMQTWLRQNGFRPGPSDGIYGPQTVSAVQRFQRAVGLPDHAWWDWDTAMAQQAYVAPPPPPPPARTTSSGGTVWDRLAQCESNGNWSINTGNGFYGGLQFTLQSWRATGGTGYPHQHSREEQIRRAEILLGMQGWGAWPTCSRIIGVR